MNTLQKELTTILNSLLDKNQNVEISFSHLPQEELKGFLDGFKNLSKILNKFETGFSQNDIEKWSLSYLLIHDLFHKSFNNNKNNISLLETEITLNTFEETKKVLNENQLKLFYNSYLLLSISTLINNHHLEHLISEKIILAESWVYGVFGISLWGYKIEKEKFEKVIEDLNLKLKNGSIEKLILRHKNFVPDFFKP